MDGLIDRVGRLRRLTRIILTMGITGALTVAAWLLVALVLGSDAGMSSAVRLVVLFGVGLPLYGYGWWILVGFDRGKDSHWRADQQAVWYLGAGCLGFVLSVVLIVVALASTDLL